MLKLISIYKTLHLSGIKRLCRPFFLVYKYLAQLLGAARHVVYLAQLLGAVLFIHFIYNHNIGLIISLYHWVYICEHE